MRILIWLIMLVLCVHFTSAGVYITEIMHSPSQMDHYDGEWVEVYNSGTEDVNLSNWTLDDKDFDDVVISSGEYLVIARELLDGDDADLDSFESYWGNNNGVWDESFKAVDGGMSLSAEDTVVLTNGVYFENITYNSSFGGTGGRTIERLGLDSWQESFVDGSPGSGSFSLTEESNNSNEVMIYLTVSNSVPEVVFVNVTTDDSSAEGVQVMPNVELDKEVLLEVYVRDSNGYESVQDVLVFVNEENYSLSFVENFNETTSKYSGSFFMGAYDLAQNYIGNVSVSDGSSTGYGNFSFEYLGILSTRLNTSALYFDMEPGEVSEGSVQITNSGNVKVDTEISATEFNGNISLEYLEVYYDGWSDLVNPVLLDLNLLPEAFEDLIFRVSVPYNLAEGDYQGSVLINSMEG